MPASFAILLSGAAKATLLKDKHAKVIKEAIKNTNYVAEMCNTLLSEEKIMPVFNAEIDEAAELSRLCREKLSSLPVYKEDNTREEYTKRLHK